MAEAWRKLAKGARQNGRGTALLALYLFGSIPYVFLCEPEPDLRHVQQQIFGRRLRGVGTIDPARTWNRVPHPARGLSMQERRRGTAH